MDDLPTEPCPKCAGTGRRRHEPEAGAVLRQHRLEQGVTAATMARELGVTRQLVNDWEVGRYRVPHDVPERWAGVSREKGRSEVRREGPPERALPRLQRPRVPQLARGRPPPAPHPQAARHLPKGDGGSLG